MSEYLSIEDVKEKLDIDAPLNILDIYKSKKKKMHEQERCKDPVIRKTKTDNERIRRGKKRLEPGHNEEVNEKQRAKYAKNPEAQKLASKNWNQTHKDQKNAIGRASYARNKIVICKRIRKKRRLIRESKE